MTVCAEGDRRAVAARAARTLGAACVAALIILVASWFEKGEPTGTTLRYLLAGVQIAAGVLAVIAMARWSPCGDELQRRIRLEALSFAFWSTAVATFSYSFLHDAGLPEVDYAMIFPAMMLLYALGTGVAWRRYR
ncbi:MAG: hypothetical protein ACE5HP_01245 [Gemmatimonadota bacterium]